MSFSLSCTKRETRYEFQSKRENEDETVNGETLETRHLEILETKNVIYIYEKGHLKNLKLMI